MVKVDSREPKYIVRYFRKRGWTVIHAKFAEAGDIADDDLSLIFERKHRTDLISSIYDGRLFSQCNRIFDLCNKLDALGFLVISGDLAESINAYSDIIKKALRKKGKKLPRNWKLNINTSHIYKYISMIPWHYDINVLWYITEEEALDAIHYTLQEMHVSDPYSRTLNKKRKSRSKVKMKKAVHTVSSSSRRAIPRRSDVRVSPEGIKPDESTYEYFKRLGLIKNE